MVHGKNRIPYLIDRRLTGLAGPDYDATISFGLPFEPEDSQYGKSRLEFPKEHLLALHSFLSRGTPGRRGRVGPCEISRTNFKVKVLDVQFGGHVAPADTLVRRTYARPVPARVIPFKNFHPAVQVGGMS